MKTVRILGIPMDLGQNQRGVDMGPSAIRYGGISAAIAALGFRVADLGDVEVLNRYTLRANGADLYTAIHQSLEQVYLAIIKENNGDFSIFLGGDHTIAIATIKAAMAYGSTGVLWFDAHGDANTPATSPSGHIHGMPLAVLLGFGHPELVKIGGADIRLKGRDVVLIGVRSLDAGERELLREQNILVLTMRDIDERGMAAVMQQGLAHLSHCARLHVSFDLDCLDPKDAPGVGTPCVGGMSYRELQLGMELIADTAKCVSLDLVEVNPILDAGNKTAQVAMELAVSLLGKRIL